MKSTGEQIPWKVRRETTRRNGGGGRWMECGRGKEWSPAGIRWVERVKGELYILEVR